jgi:molecular chaperone DnaJ
LVYFMPPSRDLYEILGVPRNADLDAIRRAFRKLAKQHHPDVNREPGAEDNFKEINEAYSVLSDPQRRAAYDRFGLAGLNGMPTGPMGGMEDLSDLFEDFFRGFGFTTGRSRRSPRRGADLQIDLSITFLEAAFGVEKDVEVERQEICSACRGSRAEPGTAPERCPVCHGTGEERKARQTFLGSMVTVNTCSRCQGIGEIIPTPCKACRGQGLERKKRTLKVPVPAGVENGTQIRLASEGGPGLFGGPAGNLYLNLHVGGHEFFHRRNNLLWLELGVNYLQAAQGAEIKVPTLDGETTLHIPPGTQPGQIFRLRGKGIPRLQQSGRGDLLVIINILVPSNLTNPQKAALHEAGIALDAPPKPLSRTLLDSLQDLVND